MYISEEDEVLTLCIHAYKRTNNIFIYVLHIHLTSSLYIYDICEF